MEQIQTYRLFELNEYIRQVLALNFDEPVWIRAELSQIQSSRGHWYGTLSETDTHSDAVMAQADLVLWKGKFAQLQRRLGNTLSELLRPGIELRLSVRVSFHERYGLKLEVDDIDPEFTLGQLDLQRQQCLLRLQQEQLLQRNQALPAPLVWQRLAVFSSPTAAGLQDFQQQLAENPEGYKVACTLFPIAVQGERVVQDFLLGMQKLEKQRDQFDSVVIIRGGGSKLDLMAFDQWELCRAAALCSLPVLSGIGHETDQSVLDLVAFQALKTPTAVAEFVLNQNRSFEMRLLELGLSLRQLVEQRHKQETVRLENSENQLRLLTRLGVQQASQRCTQFSDLLPRLVQQALRQQVRTISHLERELNLADPERLLARGYTLTLQNGRPMRSCESLRPGDLLETRFADGRVDSIVSNKVKSNEKK